MIGLLRGNARTSAASLAKTLGVARGTVQNRVAKLERDGTIENLQLHTRSGSPTLDAAAMRAIQRIDTFGPLPAGDHVPVEFQFDYHTN